MDRAARSWPPRLRFSGPRLAMMSSDSEGAQLQRAGRCSTLSEVFDSLYLTAAAKVQGLDVHSIVFDSLRVATAA